MAWSQGGFEVAMEYALMQEQIFRALAGGYSRLDVTAETFRALSGPRPLGAGDTIARDLKMRVSLREG